MMPFSVLRIWLGGIFNWLVLAAAIYCLWEWFDGVDPPRPVREYRHPQTGEIVAAGEPGPSRDRQGGWPYLASGIGLLTIGLAGGWPIVLFLGRPGGSASAAMPKGKVKSIDRPDGTRLHVEVFGGDDAPTLVFTHGWSLDRSVWSELVAKLANRFRVIIWDLPGLGRSHGPASGDYDIDKMAEDLSAVVGAAGRGPVILIGHSIGGMIIQTYCRLHPAQLGSRVTGIVLLHTTYTNPLKTALGSSLWKAIEKPILVPLNHLTIWLAPLAAFSNWQSFLNGNMHIVTRIASFSGQQTWGQLNHGAWLAAVAWPAVVARGNLAMLEFDEQRVLPQVEIPALVIAGRHDRMTKPEASDCLAHLLPNSREASVVGGHLGFWERTSEVAEMITEFAQQQDTPVDEKPAETKPTNVATN
ncbi:MAG TPA: alpha/beta hydrolase [Pirellulaceae bacterium]|nr:alpha/beta hydrolase [Pirellulaceae bacterium]